MKNYILVISLLALLSCTPESDQVFTETTYLITIVNNSGHNIDMRVVGEIIIVGSIKNNDKMAFHFSYPSNVEDSTAIELPPPPDFQEADSIRITYLEKASIWHTKADSQVVSKSLQLKSSYVERKTSSTEYEYTYIFTPEDYEEALEFGD